MTSKMMKFIMVFSFLSVREAAWGVRIQPTMPTEIENADWNPQRPLGNADKSSVSTRPEPTTVGSDRPRSPMAIAILFRGLCGMRC